MTWQLRVVLLFAAISAIAAIAVLPAAYAVAPPAPHGFEKQSADEFARQHGDELAEQGVITAAVKSAIDGRDYAALDKMANEFRHTRARTSSGIWKLSTFHWRMLTELGQPGGGQCDDRFSSFFKGWIAHSPDQPAAYIDHAAMIEDYAWCLRGAGYANTVDAQASANFSAKVEEANKLLDEHRAMASADPHFFVIMERIFIDQGAEKPEFMRLLDEATAREPDYHYLYFAAYRYFQPQWHGSFAEIDDVARYAAKRGTADERAGMYARYYWYVLDCKCDNLDQSIDWPTMRTSMHALMARYPSDWNAANFARISCVMNDAEEARGWFHRVKGDYSGAWEHLKDLKLCQDLALASDRSRERCPYAAIEGWPREDVDRYCRGG